MSRARTSKCDGDHNFAFHDPECSATLSERTCRECRVCDRAVQQIKRCAIRFDPGVMAAAVAAFLGGIVVWGSNGSTAKEAAKELAAAEADRVALIEMINPRVIP